MQHGKDGNYTMKIIDIVIVSYKDEIPLEKCLLSIKQHCFDYELYIEDNNKENRFFTKAVNDGIRKGKSPFVWLLNSDAVVLEGCQQALIDRFHFDNKIGIVGSCQLDPENPDRIRAGGFLRAFPGGVHESGFVSMGHCRFPKKQTWVNGASMVLRRAMLDSIGLLDESMVLLYSDSDICYFARSKGWSVYYEPKSRVLHKLNASKTVTEWHKKDMEAFMKKWDIKVLPDNNLLFGKEFERLDRFP
jgi:GT2 family glycosyltransferase